MMSQKNIFDFQKKKEIYEFIFQNPGVHLRELSRKLNIPRTTLAYHLKYLNKHDLILSKFVSGYKRYWAANKIGQKDKEMLILLRQDTPRNIIISITEYGIRSQIDISEDLNKHPGTIAFHLKKLKERDIIEQATVENGMVQRMDKGYWMKRSPRGTEIFYGLKNEEIKYRIINLMIAHHKKLPSDILLKYFIKYTPELFTKMKIAKKYKIINSPRRGAESVEEVILEVFPHPYHA